MNRNKHPEHGSASMPFLHAKIRSGTCKGPLNFKKNQKGFLNADVRDEVWRRKDNVLDWKKSKVLDVNESWNKTFPTNLHPVPESRTSENYVHDRSKAYAYNYRAESLDPLLMDEPIDKPTKFHISRTSSSAALTSQMRLLHEPIQRGQLRRTEEIPVNIKLANKPEWNAMTAVSPKDRNNNMNEFTMKSRSHSKRISTAMSSLDYINPLKSEVIYHATLRRQKTAGTFTPASFLDGVDHRPVDPKDLMNRYAIERPRTYNVVEHSGTWELNKTENKFCWSDTASFVPNSPGDIVRKKNLDAVSFFGPEHLYRQHSLTSPTNPIPTPPKQQKMALTAADFGFRVGH